MYVYWWHVSELRAVKVGHADDPGQHVSEYRREHGLSGKDVRGYELDSGTDAEWAESQLCRMLEAKGLRRIALRLGNEEEEFFALDGCTFEDAHELLRDGARHIAFAEVSNQRKRRKRYESQAAQESTPRPEEPAKEQVHEEARPRQRHSPARSRYPVAAQFGLCLIGAVVAWGLVTGWRGDDGTLDHIWATLTQQESPPAATARHDSESAAALPPNNPCTLVEFSDTLIQVSCVGSWALMRWKGRWIFDVGRNESDALDFFNASDVARRAAASPPSEPVPRLPEQAKVEPERLPPSNQPAAPAAPPPQPALRQAAPRPAIVQPPQAPPLPRKHCTVSRPKPGFQVYLVTCPNSQVTIGRTVDTANGWTVSESVNGTEAIEFFMTSRYAR